MLNKGLFTSNSENWGTPNSLFEQLDNEFHFSIDLCANKNNYKMEPYYSKTDNSLIQSWDNITGFCNPPYGVDLPYFIEKAYKAKNSIIVMLIPSRTDTKYWHDYVMKAKEIRFIKGRIKFENENRESIQAAPFPSAIIVFDGIDHNPIISSYIIR